MLPSKEALSIDLVNANINDDQKETCQKLIDGLNVDAATSLDWLLNTTEEFCRDRAIHNALFECIQICDGKSKNLTKESIPQIMQDALAICFDSHIGHDYFDDAQKRHEYYHLKENKIPFDIDILNEITKGGVSKKSLTVLMGGINVGKTMVMCSMAASNLREGKNVLYISLEMSEEMITQRIDANLMDLTIDEVAKLELQPFLNNISNTRKNTIGRLKVKEYPTSQAGSSNFRFLLQELKLKQNFIPDIVYVDYLNICKSSRIKQGGDLYAYVKAIGEEIRGLAVECEVPIITATQFNREGFKSSDPGLENVSESFGTGATADLVLAIVRSEELDKEKQLMFTQLKNRYSDKGKMRRFKIGIDIEKMKLYNVDDGNQDLVKDPEDPPFESFFTNEMNNSMGNFFEDNN